MMDKNIVLPLVEQRLWPYGQRVEEANGYEKGMYQQQMADWERVKPLVEAAQAVLKGLAARDIRWIDSEMLAEALAALLGQEEVKKDGQS